MRPGYIQGSLEFRQECKKGLNVGDGHGNGREMDTERE